MQDIENNNALNDSTIHNFKEYKILYNIIKFANQAKDLQHYSSIILGYVIKYLNFDGGGIYLLDKEKEFAEVLCHLNLPIEFVNIIKKININNELYHQFFNLDKSVFSENYQEINPKNSKDWGFLSIASVPLITKNEIIGALNIASKKKYEFKKEEKEFLEILGREIGTVIDKMRLEQDLIENNKKLEIIFESLQELLFVFNSDGKILYTNPRVISKLKYTKEEILNKNIIEIYPIEFYEEAKENFNRIIKNHENTSDIPLLTKDGEKIPVEITISKGIWDNQDVFIKICRDISKHIKIKQKLEKKEKDIAELKILESELKYQMILESTNEGYFEVTLNGDFIFINNRFCEIFDYTRKELLRSNFKKFIKSENDQNIIFKYFKEVYDTNIPKNNVQIKIELNNAISKIIETSIFLKFDSDQKIIGFCGIIKDITSRIKAEEKLIKSERKYRNIIENTRDAIIIVGFDGKFKYFSPQLSKILDRNDIQIGDNFINYIYREDLDYIVKIYAKAIKKKEIFSEEDLEFRAITGNGKIKWLISSTHNYINDSGELVGFITLLRDITDRKEAELQLKKSEMRYEYIINNINEAIVITDFKGKIIFATPQLYKIFGKKEGSIKGFFPFEIHPDDISRVEESYSPTLDKKSLLSNDIFEYRTLHENGDFIWISTSTNNYFDENGEITGFITTLRDVTKEKEAQKKLKGSELELKKRYKELNCLYGISKLFEDKEANLSDIINGTLYIIPFAWEASNLIKVRITYKDVEYTINDYVITKWKLTSKFNIDNYILKIEVFSIKEVNFMKDDISLLKEIGSRLKNIIVQKEAEKKLKESEEKYRSILENIKEAYYEVDLNGNFIFFNDTLPALLNYSKQELLENNYKDFMDDENKKKVFNAFNSVYNNKLDGKTIEYEVFRKDGIKLFFESSIYLKSDDYNKSIGFYGLIRDITERKKTEALREEFSQELKKQVNNKTKELNEALEQQKYYINQIMKSSRFKTEFMSTMSHELRTPLNSIIGFSELLMENEYGLLNDNQKEFVDDIRSSAEHLLEMINHILDISKIEAGKLELNFEDVSLNMIIEQVRATINPLYTKKGLKFVIKKPKNGIKIRADTIRLKEILFNLMSNAIKFTLNGEITLEVNETNENIIFKIKDTGIGIARKDFDLIFKDFKRVNSPIVHSIPGSGLGLALTKRLVNLHGGEISFFSILGKGTTFTFSIPKDKKGVENHQKLKKI